MSEALALTPQMIVVLGLLGLTIALFALELLRVDVAAVFIMVLLGLLSLVPAFRGALASVVCRSFGFLHRLYRVID